MIIQQKKFHIFGDESEFCGAIVYGLVIISAKDRPHLENEIGRLKIEFGLSANDKIHCREIFNTTASQKTPLHNLTKASKFDLLKKLLECCNDANARLWVGHVNSANIPDKLLYEGKDKTQPILEWDIRNNKVKMGFAYYAAMAPVLDILGHEKCEAWVDSDTTKISCLMRSKQANTFKMFFPINHNGKQFIPTPVKENKPPFIDIADILAYAAAHSLSTTFTKDKPFYTSMLRSTIGYSEAIFTNSEADSGATCSIRVPNTHTQALKIYAKNI